jgi:hypothetical protein
VNIGSISDSDATGTVSGLFAGGLVGANDGSVTDSYALGNVQVQSGYGYHAAGGGLVSAGEGAISDSYATGSVRGDSSADLGGLVGLNDSSIAASYATGAVSGGGENSIGGLIGVDEAQPGSLTDTYWDTDTSGIANLDQGAGSPLNDAGITGLTTAQFQSGLPQGFDPKVWAEEAKIDDGFPYLLTNKPAK